MTSFRSVLRGAWRCSLLLLLAGGLAPVGEAQAPVAAAPAAPRLIDEIEVLGTRLREGPLHDSLPVLTLRAEDFRHWGATTADELLRALPAVGFQGLTLNGNNGGRGRLTLDLRDLGPNRTLVLLNGRRLPGMDGLVDLNSIPLEMVERVDVLGDSAASTHGADAVAGVVNFVLRRAYSGRRLALSGRNSEDGGGEEASGSLSVGRSWLDSRLNLAFSGSYTLRRPVLQRERAFARRALSSARAAPSGSPEDLLDGRRDGIASVYGEAIVPEGSTALNGAPVFFRTPDEDGTLPPEERRGFQSFNSRDPRHSYDAGGEQYLNGAVSRVNGMLLGNYALGDAASAFWEVLYAQRDDRQRLAPLPLGPGTARFPQGLTFDVFNPVSENERNSRYLPDDFARQAYLGPDGAIDPDDRDPIRFNLRRRMVELGDRSYRNSGSAAGASGGFEGQFAGGPLAGLRWRAQSSFSHSRLHDVTENMVDLERALQTLNPELCRQHATEGCVEGDYFGAGGLQPEVARYIRFADKREFEHREQQLLFRLGGELLPLPAGPLSVAAGAEYRHEAGFDRPSLQARLGSSAGNTSKGSSGELSSRELFWEAQLPLLRGARFADLLMLEFGGRLTDASSFGSHYVQRSAVRYRPVPDLLLRAYLSTGYRPPRIRDLFASARDSFQSLVDPCAGSTSSADAHVAANCARDLDGRPAPRTPSLSVRTTFLGNPETEPERSRYGGVGLVLRPSRLPWLSASLEYHDIEVRDYIDSADAQQQLNECYGSASLEGRALCSRSIFRDASGLLSRLELRVENRGIVRTRGVDLGLRLQGDSRWGVFSLDALGAYLLEYSIEDESGRSELDGTFGVTGGSLPRRKALLRGSWSPPWIGGRLTLATSLQYIGGARHSDPRVDVFQRIPSIRYWNASVAYRFESGAEWFLGVNNLTDQEPPLVAGTVTNTQSATYDLVGRRFFTRIELPF